MGERKERDVEAMGLDGRREECEWEGEKYGREGRKKNWKEEETWIMVQLQPCLIWKKLD